MEMQIEKSSDCLIEQCFSCSACAAAELKQDLSDANIIKPDVAHSKPLKIMMCVRYYQ